MFRTLGFSFHQLKLLALFSLTCLIPTLVLPTSTGIEPRRDSGANEPTTVASTQDELLSDLGDLDRYQTFISTDKPIYRIGEQVYVRVVQLHHSTHKPLADSDSRIPLVQITGPKGDVVAQGYAKVQDSVAGFSWTVPDGQAGGEYTIKVTHPVDGSASAERKFDIRAYRAPRLKTQIKFLRDGYGPGDEVVAMLDVSRAEGGFPSGAKVTAVGFVDGAQVATSSLTVDSSGKSLARFSLPEKMRRGEGTLAMTIEDGGVIETASKTIPILMQTVDLNLFPEGGDLIAGLNCRVYLEAKTPAQKPADIAGVVLNSSGVQIAEFKTEHEGRGRFNFVPKLDETYTLQITQPSGIATTFKLPEVKAQGATLRTVKETYAQDEPISLEVATTIDAGYVTLCKRERVLQRIDIQKTLEGNSQLLSFDKIDSSFDGVLTATVWKDAQTPIAERLLFREPKSGVRIEIQPEKSKLTPGDKAKVKVITTDENGKRLSALVGLTVTDESVLEMIDKREQAPQLPIQVLLESDVRELADAHVYLNPNDPKAALATDLLLGTQGWRRFAVIKATEFLANHGEIGRRVLAYRLPPARYDSLMSGFGDPRPTGAGGRVEPMLKNDKEAEAGMALRAAPAPADAFAANEGIADAKKDRAPAHPARDDANLAFAEGAPAKRLSVVGGLGGRGLGGGGFGRGHADALEVTSSFNTVRVYAHDAIPNRPLNLRTDFAETLFWSAGLQTNDLGEASFEFSLSDSITSFQIAADGFSKNGGLGASRTTIQSVVPFYIESKLPMEVTAGDIIELPIAAINSTEERIDNLRWTIKAGDNKVQLDSTPFAINADSRIRQIAEIEVGSKLGEQRLEVSAATQPLKTNASPNNVTDSQTKSFVVRPLGFPVEQGRGGMVGPGETAKHDFEIAQDLVPGSMQSQVIVYPSPLASLTTALERLIQEPNGCFEQTSSTTYPLVMAQQYFMSHHGVDPSIIEKASRTLETGYGRLIGFECKSGGFEWFGQDPGHDALTAYGLMEFTDMAKVRFVDSNMLSRTKEWLLAQRDGKGTFVRKTHTLHTWLADAEIATSYNLWALLESNVNADLSKEVAWVREAGLKSRNSYVLALAANVLVLAKDNDGANVMLDKLAGLQEQAGNIRGATTSVIGSGGEALEIETTALATLAWLRNPSFAPQVEHAMRFLMENCKAGRFGSTQSTILALKAIVAYDAANATPKASGSLQLYVDNKAVGEKVAFNADERGAIKLPAFSLSAGKHSIAVHMENGNKMPYSMSTSYYRIKPESNEFCKVHLETRLTKTQLTEGDIANIAVSVINRKGEAVPTPIAIIGIPGGMEVRHDQLKEFVKANKIAAYEVRGRELILYWRDLAAEARVDLPIDLIAAVPGKYTAPASRAYLYYTDEFKHWVDGSTVVIRAK